MIRRSLALLLALSTACILDPVEPLDDGSLIVTCDEERICPDGWRCVLEVERCFPPTDDSTPPTLAGEAVLSTRRLMPGAVATLSFDVTEPLAAAPRVDVALDAEARPLELVGDDGSRFTFRYAARGDEAPEGETLARALFARMVDTSGNESGAAQVGALTFDFEAPTVSTVAVDPEHATDGELVLVRVVASEALGPAPALFGLDVDDGRRIDFELGQQADAFLSYTYTVETGDEGTYALGLEGLVDVAGNHGAAADLQQAVVVDARPPVITIEPADLGVFSAVPGFDELELRVVLDEPVQGLPFVLVGAAEADCELDAPAVVYRCSYRLTGDEDEGAVTVAVSARDLSGNLAVATAFPRFDFTGPAPVAGTAAIVLEPDDDSPLTQLARAGLGTTVRVSFAMAEPLLESSPAPSVQTSSPTELAFALDGSEGLAFAYAHTLSSTELPQGGYVVEITATDAVGNERTSELALSFEVDTVAPAPPDVEGADRVVYTRVPWGSDETQGAKAFLVEGGPGAAEPGSAVIVYDGPDIDDDAEIGRGSAAPDGSFARVALNRADRATVYVASVDRAGNRSAAAAVRDVEWVVTPGGPHRLEAHPRHREVLMSNDAVVVGAPAWAALADDVVERTSGAGAWIPWNPGGPGSAPSARAGHGTTYDAARGVVVVFGGFDGQLNDETWEWDGQGWSKECGIGTGCGGPAPRSTAALAYDAVRGTAVLFGGWNGLSYDDDTWEWDGRAWRELCAEQSCQRPAARGSHAMAYDSARRRVLLFGGVVDGAGASDETWAWDGSAWTPLCVDGGSCSHPAARVGAAMAYDASRGVVVLFGGASSLAGDGSVDETWEHDGATWSLVCGGTTSCAAPAARFHHALAFDGEHERTLLAGGRDPAYNGVDDLWAWDGASWAPLCDESAPCPRPAATTGVTFAYDAARARAVLFGGHEGGVYFDETWEHDGARWARRCAGAAGCQAPARRHGTALAVDADGDGVLLFGGMAGGQSSGDTWRWDGAAWGEVSCGGAPCPGPSARYRHALVHDRARSTTLLFGGGGSDELWRWDGGAWQLACGGASGCAGPSARAGAAVAYDVARQVVVLFGGSGSTTLGETWEWDGESWGRRCGAPMPCAEPPAREYAAAAYDEARERVVLVGGHDGAQANDETWEWDGSTWTQACGAGTSCGGPSARYAAAAVYDAARGKVLLFGGVVGSSGGDVDDGAWEWDGSTWTQVCGAGTQCSGPSARAWHAMAFHGASERALLAGDGTGGSTDNRSWEWDGGAAARPAHSFHVAWSSSGVALDDVTVRAVSARWRAGGVGSPSGGLVADGVELVVWDDGAWRRAALDTTATVDAPVDLSFSTTDAQRIGGLFVGRDPMLSFAARPRAPSDVRRASVATDYVEVRVRYSVP